MYRELIRQYAGEERERNAGRPATARQIENVQKIVGFSFPQELKALLREMDGDGWLFLSTTQMAETVKLNREYLSECYQDVDRHIFFATNGCGDYFCYNILPNGEVDVSTIYLWEHETNETHPVAAGIGELIRRYYCDEIG